MTRRIVQIATLLNPAVDGVRNNETHLYGLTDDSAVFVLVSDQYTEAWRRLPDIPQDEPAVDPIAEIEAMGGRLITGTDDGTIWMLPGALFEVIGGSNVMPSHLRAAAARLLERVRGAK